MADVTVTYDDINSAGERLQTEHQDMEAKLQQLEAYIQGLVESGYVSGSGQAFNQEFQDFTRGAKQMLEGLGGMGQFLKTAAQTFRDTDEGLRSGISG
jgi:WXG100 family type VII secretion target